MFCRFRTSSGCSLLPPPFGLFGLPARFLLVQRLLSLTAQTERAIVVRLNPEGRIAASNRSVEVTSREPRGGLGHERIELRLTTCRGFTLLPGDLDLGVQPLELSRIGSLGSGFAGEPARLVDGALHQGLARALERLPDPLLARTLPGRELLDSRHLGAEAFQLARDEGVRRRERGEEIDGSAVLLSRDELSRFGHRMTGCLLVRFDPALLVQRRLRPLADRPCFLEPGIVQLRFRAGTDRSRPLAPLEAGPCA